MTQYYNPYSATGEWFKSCFHIHPGTGKETVPMTPENIFHVYRKAGYQVLMFSGQGELFDLKEFAKSYPVHMINGTEYIEQDGILLIGTKSIIRGTPQQAVDLCRKQGGISVICHPNWISAPGLPAALSSQTRMQLKGVTGIEILTACIDDRFLGSGYATDVWTQFLDSGRCIWGFANDDFHEYHDAARAWNYVCCPTPYYESEFLNSLRRGSLYCSTGLVLRHFYFDGITLSVQADYPMGGHGEIWYRFIGKHGRILKEESAVASQYRLKNGEAYVRVEAIGNTGAKLWTQPLLRMDLFDVEAILCT